LKAGEFSDETEIAPLHHGNLTRKCGSHPELIRARMQFLSRDESRRWMDPETLRSLDDEAEPWYRSPGEDDPEVALRGISIGMIHAAPVIDGPALRRDVAIVVGLTHSSARMVDLGTVVALAVAWVLAGHNDQRSLLSSLAASAPNQNLGTILARAAQALQSAQTLPEFMVATETGDAAVDAVVSGIGAFALANRFEDAVFAAAAAGGATDSRAALAGALAGAHFGAGGIPQMLIDELEGRIYLTLAAPWFYRTIQLMTGRGIALGSETR